MKKKNHKFDPISDKCERCGVMRRKVPFIGNGISGRGIHRMGFVIEYSSDGIQFSKEWINCNG